MDIPINILREEGLDKQQVQNPQEKLWSYDKMTQCKNCIACHEYPEGMCCTVQAEKYGKPYLINEMVKCPGLPKKI